MKRSIAHKKPTPPETPEDTALARRFERRVTLSRLALLGERIWEALLWPFVIVCAFLILSLLDAWSIMPPLLHRVLLAAFGIGLLISLLPLLRLPLPTRAEALRRLERSAGIKHRPASSYEDRLGATPVKETATLWALHRERLSRLIDRLRAEWPKPRTDRSDPYAIRAALLLGLVAAFIAAGGNSWNRLTAAFSPAQSGAASLLRLDAWVTPPIYTGLPPIVLADGSEPAGAGAESFRALSVPERSELIVRAHSPHGESVSLLTSKEGETAETAVEPKPGTAEGLVEFDLALTKPGSADVRVGGSTIAKWRFDLIKDELPQISLMGNPTVTPRGALRLVYAANDDHGVASAEARFALAEGEDAGALAKMPPTPEAAATGEKPKADPLLDPPIMPLQLPRVNEKKVDGRASQDLTAHPWAGLKVRMTLIARDQAGQTGESQPYEFVLPERKFTKPLAKAVVEQRKKLVRHTDASDGVAQALDALTLGADKVIDDSVVYLGLRNAFWRLQSDRTRDGIASVVGQLWDIALRIEEGDLPEAERDVKSAQDKLMKALQENASAEEIQKLVEELKDALSRYLQALATQQQDKGNLPPQQNQDGDQLVSEQELDKMLKNIEDLAKAGSKDLAQQMLSELKDILDRLQTGNFSENAEQQRASRIMKDLNEVISKQQKLLDDTFNAKRQQSGEEAEEFEVSPPGQPMEFGPNINMAPLFEMPEEEGQQESKDGQNNSKEGEQGKSFSQGKQGAPHGGKLGQQNGPLGDRQSGLRNQLQSLIDRLRIEGANPPQQFEDAGEAMKDAKDSIDENNLDRATQNQGLALDRLRKGAQSMAEQMEQQGEAQTGEGPGNNGRDPLGRPDRSNRPDLGLSVRVPDQIDIQRAREVLDELRRRLGDPARPAIELDYLERLIRSF